MKSESRGADDLAGVFGDFLTGKSKAAFERQRMDRKVEELVAELEADKEAKAVNDRSFRIHTFEV
jgi:hypothetical protein